MKKFDLDSEKVLNLVNDYVSEIVSVLQFKVQQAGQSNLYLIKNTPLVNTAVDLASESIEYHGIPLPEVTNEKKCAHVCFWLLKLTPISYVNKYPTLGRVSPPSKSPINIEATHPHIPFNTHVSYLTFLSLYCYNNFPEDRVTTKVNEIYKKKYSSEIIRSLRFHNHSARSMAMFLETLMMERLV